MNLAKDEFDWDDLKGMMTDFLPPAVISHDGPVSDVNGSPTDTALSTWLKYVWRIV